MFTLSGADFLPPVNLALGRCANHFPRGGADAAVAPAAAEGALVHASVALRHARDNPFREELDYGRAGGGP